MASHEITIELAAPPETVHALLADVGRWAEWDPSIRTIEPLGVPTGEVGDRYSVTVGFYGRAIEQVHEVVETTAPSRFAVASTGRATGRWEFDLSPADGGTRLVWSTTLKLGGLARLLDKGLDLALAGLVENAADGLRRQVDTPAAH